MKKIIFTILAILAMFAFACENAQQSVKTDFNAETSAQQESKETAKPSTSSEKTETKAETKTDVSVKTNSNAEFMKLFNAKSSLQWQVDYDLKTNSRGQQMSSKMTQYLKGADKIRMDVTAQGVDARTYFVANVVTSCSQMQGEWNCYKIDISKQKESSGDTSQFEEKMKENEANYAFESDGTMQVAQVSAKCFKVAEKDGNAKIRYCFSNEGVPLYVKFESEDMTSEMTATKYSKSVSDRVFELPASAKITDVGNVQNDPCAACNFLSGEMKENCLKNC